MSRKPKESTKYASGKHVAKRYMLSASEWVGPALGRLSKHLKVSRKEAAETAIREACAARSMPVPAPKTAATSK